ncbi:MAG: hypothetical protein V4649_08170 [Bacteroidota bacterium]
MSVKKYIASRVSEGNRLFPAEIHIEETEIMLKFPGFFSEKSRHIMYQQVEGVHVDSPMIGYSTITFVVGGERFVGHGFTKAEVEEIKDICSEKISDNAPRNGGGNISIADEVKKLKEVLDDGIITQQGYDTQKARLLDR